MKGKGWRDAGINGGGIYDGMGYDLLSAFCVFFYGYLVTSGLMNLGYQHYDFNIHLPLLLLQSE